MQLKDMFMMLVIIGLFGFCIAAATYSLYSEYNEDNMELKVIDDMQEDVENINEAAESSKSLVTGGDISAGGILGVIFNEIGAFLKMVLDMILIPFKWLAAAGEELGIPKPITTALITLIIIAAVFAVVSAILKKNV